MLAGRCAPRVAAVKRAVLSDALPPSDCEELLCSDNRVVQHRKRKAKDNA